MKQYVTYRAFLFVPMLLFIGAGNLLAQKQTTSLITINKVKYKIEARFLNNPAKFSPREHLTYCWFKARELHVSRGGYDGQLLHGEYTEFYPNNNLKQKGNYNKGLRNGQWKTWHPNGEADETMQWNKGVKHGKFSKYNAAGKLVLVAHYKKGKLHGETISYENGEELKRTLYKKGEEVKKETVEETAKPEPTKEKTTPKWQFWKKPKKEKKKKEKNDPTTNKQTPTN